MTPALGNLGDVHCLAYSTGDSAVGWLMSSQNGPEPYIRHTHPEAANFTFSTLRATLQNHWCSISAGPRETA